MSWRPPWVEVGDEGSEDEGRRYLGTATWRDVPDNIGLDRYPLTCWTLNCKYNAVYDVHHLNTGANGNPHYHGFSIGRRGPRINRVRADVEGVGDEPPDVDAELRDILDHLFGSDDVSHVEISKSIVLERIRKHLSAVLPL